MTRAGSSGIPRAAPKPGARGDRVSNAIEE